MKRVFSFFLRITIKSIDKIIHFKYLLFTVLLLTMFCIVHYFILIIQKTSISEHIFTYLLFGLVTVVAFFFSYRIYNLIQPTETVEDYLDFLNKILKDTFPEDDLLILASTPNPGLTDYLKGDRITKEKYQTYKDLLFECVKQRTTGKMAYRVLELYDEDSKVIKDNIEKDDWDIDKFIDEATSPMLQFLRPFIKKFKKSLEKKKYLSELTSQLNEISSIIEFSSPIMNQKGFLIIYHPRYGFIGVYDAEGGVLKIRGSKITDKVFLETLKILYEKL